MSGHPSRDELRRWLSGEPLSAVDHLEGCDECLGTLEELSELDPYVKRVFLAVMEPRAGFIERLRVAIGRRRRDAETWTVLADLFSLSWRTPDAMWPDDG